jgi:hypothetical protein
MQISLMSSKIPSTIINHKELWMQGYTFERIPPPTLTLLILLWYRELEHPCQNFCPLQIEWIVCVPSQKSWCSPRTARKASEIADILLFEFNQSKFKRMN